MNIYVYMYIFIWSVILYMINYDISCAEFVTDISGWVVTANVRTIFPLKILAFTYLYKIINSVNGEYLSQDKLRVY